MDPRTAQDELYWEWKWRAMDFRRQLISMFINAILFFCWLYYYLEVYGEAGYTGWRFFTALMPCFLCFHLVCLILSIFPLLSNPISHYRRLILVYAISAVFLVIYIIKSIAVDVYAYESILLLVLITSFSLLVAYNMGVSDVIYSSIQVACLVALSVTAILKGGEGWLFIPAIVAFLMMTLAYHYDANDLWILFNSSFVKDHNESSSDTFMSSEETGLSLKRMALYASVFYGQMHQRLQELSNVVNLYSVVTASANDSFNKSDFDDVESFDNANGRNLFDVVHGVMKHTKCLSIAAYMNILERARYMDDTDCEIYPNRRMRVTMKKICWDMFELLEDISGTALPFFGKSNLSQLIVLDTKSQAAVELVLFLILYDIVTKENEYVSINDEGESLGERNENLCYVDYTVADDKICMSVNRITDRKFVPHLLASSGDSGNHVDPNPVTRERSDSFSREIISSIAMDYSDSGESMCDPYSLINSEKEKPFASLGERLLSLLDSVISYVGFMKSNDNSEISILNGGQFLHTADHISKIAFGSQIRMDVNNLNDGKGDNSYVSNDMVKVKYQFEISTEHIIWVRQSQLAYSLGGSPSKGSMKSSTANSLDGGGSPESPENMFSRSEEVSLFDFQWIFLEEDLDEKPGDLKRSAKDAFASIQDRAKDNSYNHVKKLLKILNVPFTTCPFGDIHRILTKPIKSKKEEAGDVDCVEIGRIFIVRELLTSTSATVAPFMNELCDIINVSTIFIHQDDFLNVQDVNLVFHFRVKNCLWKNCSVKELFNLILKSTSTLLPRVGGRNSSIICSQNATVDEISPLWQGSSFAKTSCGFLNSGYKLNDSMVDPLGFGSRQNKLMIAFKSAYVQHCRIFGAKLHDIVSFYTKANIDAQTVSRNVAVTFAKLAEYAGFLQGIKGGDGLFRIQIPKSFQDTQRSESVDQFDINTPKSNKYIFNSYSSDFLDTSTPNAVKATSRQFLAVLVEKVVDYRNLLINLTANPAAVVAISQPNGIVRDTKTEIKVKLEELLQMTKTIIPLFLMLSVVHLLRICYKDLRLRRRLKIDSNSTSSNDLENVESNDPTGFVPSLQSQIHVLVLEILDFVEGCLWELSAVQSNQ